MIRSLLYVFWLYATMAAIGISFAPFAAFSHKAAVAAARIWTRAAVWGVRVIVGLRVEVRGRENLPSGAVLVAAKHQAMLDTLLPFVLFDDPAIILKQELKNAPVFGWYTQRTGMIALDREGHAGALRKMLKEAREAVAAGRSIVIFPEGTRQAPGAAPDYKPGVAAIYRDLKVPCAPIALNTGLFWPAKGLWRKPGLAVIEFLPAIPAGLSREEFMKTLESRIETASNALLPVHAS